MNVNRTQTLEQAKELGVLDSIIRYCKRISFNPAADDLLEMMRGYNEEMRIQSNDMEDNKELALKLVKQFL